jgi:arylsulfatase A-like enzyme
MGGWAAIRQGQWRAVRPAANKPWELYDVSADPSESKDLATAQPDTLGKLKALAESARVPAVEGTFTTTQRHERDRRAKFGKQDEPEAPKAKKATRKAKA